MTIPAQSSITRSFQFGLIIHCHVSRVIASWSLAHGVIDSIWSHNNDSPLTPFQEKIFHCTSWFSRGALFQHPCEALIIFILLHIWGLLNPMHTFQSSQSSISHLIHIISLSQSSGQPHLVGEFWSFQI